MKICKVEKCESKHYSLGYCSRHYQQFTTYGYIKERVPRDRNEFVNRGKYCEIILYKCSTAKETARSKVDKKNLEKIIKYKWHLDDKGYAKTSLPRGQIRMQHLVLPLKKGLFIDHKDGNRLNNLEKNLRYATQSQNNKNKNKKIRKECWWRKDLKKWQTGIMVNYKRIHLGYFINKNDAILAKIKAEKKYFGKFAPKRD